MENRMLQARILQGQGYTQNQIAEILRVTDRTVRRYLSTAPRPRKTPVRQSKLDPFRDQIRARLDDNPFINGEILYESLLKSGYTGKRSILKDYITKVRRDIQRSATIRYETEPGFQAQMDWVDFGKQWVDGRWQKLYAFVIVLGYSRLPFVRFTSDMTSATLLACHEEAFRYFGGVPSEILYDNMKTAWIYDGECWKPNKRLAAFACHHGFAPRRCRVRRPETKGKVERFNQYLEGNFFASIDNDNLCIDALNESVLDWIDRIRDKIISGVGESRAKRFADEQPHLKPIVYGSFDLRDSYMVMVNRESCITWKTNKYSVPPEYIGRELTLRPDVFTNRADVYAEGTLVRSIRLEESGAMKRVFFPEDREKIRVFWEQSRKRDAKLRMPKRRIQAKRTVDVVIRSPSVYDQLIPGGFV